jgi:SAM-dependent methyltransferase
MISQSLLRLRQYAGPGNLTAREALWAHYSGPSHVNECLDALDLAGTETVLDVGCGYGRYLTSLRQRGHRGRLLGLDASAGMAAAAAAAAAGDAGTVVADASALPVVDAGADAALAMHMLYHVPGLPAAVAELRRVVRPGGVLLASTNGAQHIAEIRAVMDQAAARVVGQPRIFTSSFSLENGAEVLGARFHRVERHDRLTTVVVPAAEPVLGYVASFGPELAGLPDGAPWQEFLAVVEAIVRGHVARHGAFTVTGHPGYFRCT